MLDFLGFRTWEVFLFYAELSNVNAYPNEML